MDKKSLRRGNSTSSFVDSQRFKEHSQMGSGNPMSQKEWDELQATLPRGSYVIGKVVSVHPFGVFVHIGLDPRIPLLLEIVHFWDRSRIRQRFRSFGEQRSRSLFPAH
jgi:hypothetical protein